MRYVLILLLLLFVSAAPTFAAVDPRSTPNNKVGIGVLSPEADLSDAAAMVNSGGDWGWMLIIIKRSEMNVDRWQNVFNKMNKLRVIPIVRLATDFNTDGSWQKPSDEDAQRWADFLSKLNFPVKNKYVQVYNEVNHAPEWGGKVDPFEYARELDKTITALKAKSDDFYILESPLDLSAPNSGDSMDAGEFFAQMETASPGIFKKLDGWASHSYPNPGFSAEPTQSGRIGIDGYKWELEVISQYTDGRDLPVFITETGWDRKKVNHDKVAQNFEVAFKNVWNDTRIVAVCPFIFDYPDGLFHSFSFKTAAGVLGEKYYLQYNTIKDLPKEKGSPARVDSSLVVSSYIPRFVLTDTRYLGQVVLKNTGNFIWQKENLNVRSADSGIDIESVEWNRDEVYPGDIVTGQLSLKVPGEGEWQFGPAIYNSDNLVVNLDFKVISETVSQRAFRFVKQIFNV